MSKRKTPAETPLQSLEPERPPARVLWIYALGQLGWSLAAYGVSNLLIYFYMPPETGQPIFPPFVFQGAVLGVFTLIGILSAAGRFFDAVIDPLVANWSDRSKAPGGKRRWFLARGAVPFALFATLVFYPLNAAESAGNFAWMAFCLLFYYFFFAFYVIPYTALIPELGHSPQDRMKISTLISITWALGFIAGNSAYALQSYFEAQGQNSVQAFQTAQMLLNGAALVFMLIPGLFLNENRYARQAPSDHRLRHALRVVLGNPNFRTFLASDLMYWLALNFIQLGIGFYVTLLFGLDKSYAFVFSLVSFLCSFAFYAPVLWLERRLGKRRLMLSAFWLFIGLFIVVGGSRSLPFPKEMVLYVLGVLAAGPLAVFGILPNALIGDLVEQEEKSSGQQLAGMFFGVRAFVMKVGISLANLLFPSLLLLGRSADNPAGVQLTTVMAVVFSLAGWQFFRKFQEGRPTV